MNQHQKQIIELNKVDPLSEAEKLTGTSYKDDEATTWLGMALQMQKGRAMRELLSTIDDTQFSEKADEYIRKVSKFGFEVVYTEEFEYRGIGETFYILFHEPLGIILHFDTFGGINHNNVNGGNFYYNWCPNDWKDRQGLTSSGHFWNPNKDYHLGLIQKDLHTPYIIENYPETPQWSDELTHSEWRSLAEPVWEKQNELINTQIAQGTKPVWIGGHDCREATITKIKNLFENGTFLPIWKECTFPWLCPFSEFKGNYDLEEHYAATRERLKKFPEKVLRCINNTYRP